MPAPRRKVGSKSKKFSLQYMTLELLADDKVCDFVKQQTQSVHSHIIYCDLLGLGLCFMNLITIVYEAMVGN